MISLAIIGQGNVAFHLYTAFSKVKGVQVTQLNSRKKLNTSAFDVAIIAVSDDAISEVSKKIPQKETLVVHTSGSVAMNDLKNNGRKGVLYPLQSFSKDKTIDFNEVPFCLEAENDNDLALLERLVTFIGKKIYHINSLQRRQLHVAAVFVNNFVNHLYKIGNDICQEHTIPFEILYPLIKETSSKVEFLTPDEAQTGPAKRNDKKTIKNHLDLLNKEQQKIYKLITKSIQNG